ncbi:MAG: tetratricopeptide repeat protein, partial [Cyanobacteria bacterium HKST-UBA02]|nr:tetratricopeptide repeat protein [Cyanobacteria bacterium HKST-UBA02]
MNTRIERDSMGEMPVPAGAYYGASTARAVINFPVSDLRFPREFIRALGLIKQCAARVNLEFGDLDKRRADAIIRAAAEVVRGDHDRDFVVDIFQTGSGTSTNMNANEVIANRAIEILGGERGDRDAVHPNDHVNLSMSSNDVIPTAIHLAASMNIEEKLRPALLALAESLRKKSIELMPVLKTGRTHLQDATPVTLGQEFTGYAGQIERALEYRQESAAILEKIGDRYRLAIARINIGRIYRETGDEAKAIEYLGVAIEALEDLQPTGYPIASAYHTLGEMHRLRGNLDLAQSYLERGLSIREHAGDLAGQASSCHALASLCIDRGDLEQAADLLARGLRTVQDIELPSVEQSIYLQLTRLHEVHGDFGQALESHKRAFELQRRIFDETQTRNVTEMQTRFDAERKEREAEIYHLKYVELKAEAERRRDAERAFIQSQKQESLGVMAGGVAHDFN